MENIETIEKETHALITKAESFQITTQTDYSAAGEFLKVVKELEKEVKATFEPIVRKAHEAHKEAKFQENKHLEPIKTAEQTIKARMVTYYNEQERIRLEEQRKADEAAEKAAAKRKAELEAQAAKHEEKGNVEKAEERREMIEEVEAETVVIASKVDKVEGVQMRDNWDFTITDQSKLIAGLLANPMLAHLVIVDEKELRKLVKSYKDKLKIEGLKVTNKRSIAA